MEKSRCIFCKKYFYDIIKHEDNCKKQYVVMIGPDQEKVKCKHCNKIFYKDDRNHYKLINNKVVDYVEFGIWKHLKCSHKVIVNIEIHYEKLEYNFEPIENEVVDIREGHITKKIPESDYLITEFGKVYNKRGRELKTSTHPNGSRHVTLTIEGERRTKQIGYFVALAFLENTHSCCYINHKDGNIKNDHYTNLEWVDKRQYIKK